MKNLMQHKTKLIAGGAVLLAVLAVFLLAPQDNKAVAPQSAVPAGQHAAAPAAGGEPKKPWTVRCTAEEKTPGRECEVYQRLVVAKTGQRVAEFAVGFPKNKKEGRGVIILPLGILLNDGIEMQIDSGQTFKFRPRYCTNDGCFAFIDINNQLLDTLKSSSMVEFSAKAMNGKDVKIRMTLKGMMDAMKVAAEG